MNRLVAERREVARLAGPKSLARNDRVIHRRIRVSEDARVEPGAPDLAIPPVPLPLLAVRYRVVVHHPGERARAGRFDPQRGQLVGAVHVKPLELAVDPAAGLVEVRDGRVRGSLLQHLVPRGTAPARGFRDHPRRGGMRNLDAIRVVQRLPDPFQRPVPAGVEMDEDVGDALAEPNRRRDVLRIPALGVFCRNAGSSGREHCVPRPGAVESEQRWPACSCSFSIRDPSEVFRGKRGKFRKNDW